MIDRWLVNDDFDARVLKHLARSFEVAGSCCQTKAELAEATGRDAAPRPPRGCPPVILAPRTQSWSAHGGTIVPSRFPPGKRGQDLVGSPLEGLLALVAPIPQNAPRPAAGPANGLPGSGVSLQAQPSGGAKADQDFGERSAVNMVAGRAMNRRRQAYSSRNRWRANSSTSFTV
jgi:hypothetical protein